MNRIRGVSVCCIAVFLSSQISAQSIAPSTFNAAGGSATIAGNTHEFSIGEMSMVSTSNYPTGSVTHGILQPANVIIESIEDELSFNDVFSVYPNPSDGILQLDTKNGTLPNAVIVYDALGKLIIKTTKQQISTSTKIDLSTCASGQYLVVVQTSKKNYNIKITKK
jgi:hypothetical protein